MLPIDVLVKLPADEEEKFAAFIKQQRNKLISSPKETAKRATESNQAVISKLLKQQKFSEAILLL